MNIKQLAFASFVVLAVVFPYNTANAGFLDWVGITKESIDFTVEKSWSLDSIYEFIRTDTVDEQTNSFVQVSIIQENAVMKLFGQASVSTKGAKGKKILAVEASGYSSTPDQTDDTPFITANGAYVRDGIIATNILPFGTFVKIPSVYGNKIFVVEDRMNKRYQNHIDIWFPDRQSAMEFGRRTVQIEIL